KSAELGDLLAKGELTQPLTAMQEFLHGGTALELAKGSAVSPSQEVSEFSRKDANVWVYSMWLQKGKLSKGILSASVYDERNQLRVSVPAQKVSLSNRMTRTSFGFSPASLQPGVYRVDLIWDEHPVWRTFVRITD